MSAPALDMLEKLLGHEAIEKIKSSRQEGGKSRRKRKMGVVGLLGLCLAVAADTGPGGLGGIIREYIADLGVAWTLTASAFTKARGLFSPRAFPVHT